MKAVYWPYMWLVWLHRLCPGSLVLLPLLSAGGDKRRWGAEYQTAGNHWASSGRWILPCPYQGIVSLRQGKFLLPPRCVSFLPLKHVSWVTFYWDWQVICAVATSTNRMLIFYFAGMQETEWGGMKILLTCTGQCSRFINNLLLWSLDQAWQYSTV